MLVSEQVLGLFTPVSSLCAKLSDCLLIVASYLMNRPKSGIDHICL